MCTAINNPASCKVRAVIRFLLVRNNNAAEIHRQLCEVYGPNVMSDSKVRQFVWYTDGSRMKEGTGAGVFGQTLRRLSFSLGRYTTVFQAEIYAILSCAYEIQSQYR